MRSSQLHGGIRRVNRWTTLALTIFLLTCPLVVLQVQVAPGSSLQLPPEGLKGRKPGCWQVSSLGRLRNSRGRISHGSLAPSGYCAVHMCGSCFRVHRLIAYAFLGPPPSDAAWQVNHIDGNHSNNRVENLEWVSRSENVRHSYATNPSRGNAGPSSTSIWDLTSGPAFHPSNWRQKHCLNCMNQLRSDAAGIRR